MLDSIYIGMSGLMGYSKGLRVIANNTANINTPGFKGSSLQFGDLVTTSGDASGSPLRGETGSLGQGLATYNTTLDFSSGDLRPTGNDLDLAIDGQGLFMLRDETGATRYTRAGEFKFDEDGALVSRISNAKVMGQDENGKLVEISLDGLRTNPAKATSLVTIHGVLDATKDTETITDMKLLDAVGVEHHVTLTFENEEDVRAGLWAVKITEGTKEIGSGTLQFIGGQIDPSAAKVTFTYKPEHQDDMEVTLDFSSEFSTAGSSSLGPSVFKTDDYVGGSLTNANFDEDGVLNLTYSNGQTVKGPRIALARFDSIDMIRAVGDNTFEATNEAAWEHGFAGTGGFGPIRSGTIEISNVDLSSEFSDLVIMQRGYQASSQVVSTANDMIQELFSMKGGR